MSCPCRTPDATQLAEKREAFFREAGATLASLTELLARHGQELIDVAWARHVTGHIRYGDEGLYEFTEGDLAGERFTELADAFIFENRRLQITTDL